MQARPAPGVSQLVDILRPCIFTLAALASTGCTRSDGPSPKLAAASGEELSIEHEDPGASFFEAEIGGLSQEDVDEQFQALLPRMVGCVRRTSGQASYLGGRVSLRMRVDRAGSVRWAYLADSTLGDRDVERCVLDLVRSRTWPKPLSGEGLAETSFDIEPADDPAALPAHQRSWLAQRASVATRGCRKGIDGVFTATAYVDPNGQLLSVGVAPPSERGEEAADCVIEALRALRVGKLASAEPSKVSFRIR